MPIIKLENSDDRIAVDLTNCWFSGPSLNKRGLAFIP